MIWIVTAFDRKAGKELSYVLAAPTAEDALKEMRKNWPEIIILSVRTNLTDWDGITQA